MTTELKISMGFVYENALAERRLVVRVISDAAGDVVIWRTPDPSLKKGLKSQGSAKLESFQKWAVKRENATLQDWSAFEQVERRRLWSKRDSQALNRYRKSCL